MYSGNKVRLRAHRADEAAQFAQWINHPAMARQLQGQLFAPFSQEQEAQWINDHAGRRTGEAHFAVETLEGQLIGGCSFHAIDFRNRHCMVGWFIGEADMRGNGYGTDMIETLLRVGFEEFGLHKISLEVFEHNEAAVRLYERLGFVREGAMREQIFAMDRWWAVFRYGMLRTEWDAMKLSR